MTETQQHLFWRRHRSPARNYVAHAFREYVSGRTAVTLCGLGEGAEGWTTPEAQPHPAEQCASCRRAL